MPRRICVDVTSKSEVWTGVSGPMSVSAELDHIHLRGLTIFRVGLSEAWSGVGSVYGSSESEIAKTKLASMTGIVCQ